RWRPGLRVRWSHANSSQAIDMLACGQVHAAGIHISATSMPDANAQFVKGAIPGRAISLVHLGVWEEGLAVTAGNPKGIRRVGDVAAQGLKLVNRELGAGARRLLDELLEEDGIPGEAVTGYGFVVNSHREAVSEVAAGNADAGMTVRSMAQAFGLDFVPLRSVSYDLAFMEEYLRLDPVRRLLSTLEHRWVRAQLSLLGAYDISDTGSARSVGA
ncbi:MAG TPA: substrate-binding domain-containing protein, partial [Chthonomonadales bacterium]|nr:substrate-binding domain-containing protein [Chthonomonadales bacterium]